MVIFYEMDLANKFAVSFRLFQTRIIQKNISLIYVFNNNSIIISTDFTKALNNQNSIKNNQMNIKI